MDQKLFTNTNILAWLQYFSENTDIDLEHVKILDITRKNKNAAGFSKTIIFVTEVVCYGMDQAYRTHHHRMV